MSARERAAEVLRAEEQKILGRVDFERHRDSCVGEINGMRRALRLLADAGLFAGEAHDRAVAARALRDWGTGHAERYPEDVFIPPTAEDWGWLALLVMDHGRTLDAFSADIMRRAARLAIEDADRVEAGDD